MTDFVILSPAGGIYTHKGLGQGWAETPERWREAVHYGINKLAFDKDGNKTSKWRA